MSDAERSEVERVRFEPSPTDVSESFWEGTRQGELRLPWCTACGRAHWYPRRRCPHCGSSAIEWRASPGTGTLAAVSVQHRAAWPGLADRVPYAVGVVRLDEGVQMLAGIEGLDVDDPQAAVGRPVDVSWEDLREGRGLALYKVGGFRVAR
jgi:uncharacterized OB-fold protein